MFKITQSLLAWLLKFHKDIAHLVYPFGHIELITEEMWKDYLKWCQTEEGKQYLKGGSEYDDKWEDGV